MNKLKILIAGCGDVGITLAKQLCQIHEVYALRRSNKQYPFNVTPIQADLLNRASLKQLPSVDVVVYCAAPGSQDNGKSTEQRYQETYIDGFKHLIDALPKQPKQVLFTSSTSVYGQDNHQWINEQSATEPSSEKGQLMLKAEQQVLNCNFPSTVVRFSGIYAHNRLHLLKQVLAGKVSPKEPVKYSNRIHVQDCASVLAHLISLSQREPLQPVYLASDDNPASIGEVSHFLAEASQSSIKKQTINRSTPSKRCDNSLLKASGYCFKFPDYKAGYLAILKQLHSES